MKKGDVCDGYVVGFADGEGTFNIVKYPNNRIRPQFLLFNTNKEILQKIKEYLKINSPILEVSRVDNIFRRKKCYRLQVRAKQDVGKIVLFFDKNKPIVKEKDYENFRKAWIAWNS
jgi:hypothetical protein